MNGYFRLAFLITLIFFFSSSLQAQFQSIDSLRTVIGVKVDSLAQLFEIQKRLAQSFDVLNATIFSQKKELENSSNPILRLHLNGNLKESARLAAKMDKLLGRIRHFRHELQSDYQRIIAVADSIVKQKMKAVNSQNDDRSRIATIKMISKLEMEKKTWQKKLAELAPAVPIMPSLEIEADDNIERLQLKIKLLHDRLRQLQVDIEKLSKRFRELQSDLQIYEEMINFMDNLQQNIDPEQEYFDQERSDQLKEEVRNTKLKISEINKHTKQLIDEKAKLEEKLQQFEDYFQNKFKK